MTLFFAINQSPDDGSAHAIYCLRKCWWLAKTNPAARVILIYPGATTNPFQLIGLGALNNLATVGLFAVRRPKRQRGITINAVYYWSLYRYLSRHGRAQDVFVSASFPKLFATISRRLRMRGRGIRLVYEAHQLGEWDDDAKAQSMENSAFKVADLLFGTTQPIVDALKSGNYSAQIILTPLACGWDPKDFPSVPDQPAGKRFVLGYVGSLYEEQGVDWLASSIHELGDDLEFRIGGGGSEHLTRLKKIAQGTNVQLYGRVGIAELPTFMKDVDALVIPALSKGRMPYVAITKAYDYLAMKRPILASDLPSIRDVLRPEIEALLFEPGSVQALRSLIKRLRDCPALGASLVRNALVRSQEFSWHQHASRYWSSLETFR